jgi:circadian clock protein KaiC
MNILPTGIAGLDTVLTGGLLRGDLYLVLGGPGTGKTTLAHHIAFQRARAGEAVVYSTTLSETHARMISHLANFSFFDQELIGDRVNYLSIYDTLRADGLDGVLAQLRQLVRQYRPTLLVIDGAGMFGRAAATGTALAEFNMALQTQIAGLGCTTLLLSDQVDSLAWGDAHLMDGIIVLHDQPFDLRQNRFLEVVKVRGVDYLRGRHALAITADGIAVYPRLESLVPHAQQSTPGPRAQASFGIDGLDQMLRGGLPVGSTSLLLGAPGAGKTTTGLHFVVEGARRGEPGLITSFHESQDRLIHNAGVLTSDLQRFITEGRIRVLSRPPVEVLLDEWSMELLEALDRHQPRRLLIEGLNDLEQLALFPGRMYAYLAALTTALRARNVTTLLSAELGYVVGEAPQVPLRAGSADIENVILLRYVELRSRLRRLVSIVKSRGIGYDTDIREFTIGDYGVRVGEPFTGVDAVLTGVARTSAQVLQPAPSNQE